MRILCRDNHRREFYESHIGFTSNRWSCTHCDEYITSEGIGLKVTGSSITSLNALKIEFKNHVCKERITELKTGEKIKIEKPWKDPHNDQHSAHYDGPHGWG